MKKSFWAYLIITGLFSFAVAGTVQAAGFEQAFKLTKINGECKIMTVNSKVFADAAEGQTYPYGSKISTGRKSSAIIEFSSGNFCRVLASTVLTVTENAKDQKAKTINLAEGRIDVELEEKFHENNSLTVETAAAICGAIGCKASFSSSSESDLKVVVISCNEGKWSVKGPDFEIPVLDRDTAISLSKAIEKDFVRIKNVKGVFNMSLKNSKGENENVEIKLGYSVKIYREVSNNGANMLVYALVLTPEGKTETTHSYTRPIETFDTEPKDKDKGKGKDKGKDKDKDDTTPPDDGTIPTTPTTTVTAKTTTTTMPPKDDTIPVDDGIIPITPTTTVTTRTTTTTIPPKDSLIIDKPSPTPVGNR